MTGRTLLHAALRDSARTKLTLLEREEDCILNAAALLVETVERGNKVLLCGNGGSAGDAQHISAELVGRYVRERRPLPAIALNTDTSALTAIGNDYGYEQVFARQVSALGQRGDLLIAITTSGKSPNVVAAIAAAREKGMFVIGLTGSRGDSLRDICDVAVLVPSTITARIQECHIAIGHVLCEILDERVGAAIPSEPPAIGAPVEPHSPRTTSSKELSRFQLSALGEHARACNKRVVWTNGVFDVLHAGHLASLRAARAYGDILVVGINADAAVTTAKGPDRPIFPVTERAELVAGLECVDYIHIFEEPTPQSAIAQLRPCVHCKGADYAPPSGKPIPEAELVASYGGTIQFLPMVPDRSTTATAARIRAL